MAGRKGRGVGGIQVLALVTAAAPLVVLAAIFGARAGAWSAEFAFETLTLTFGRYLALAGVGAAALAVVLALQDMKRRWVFAAAAVLIAGATLTVFLIQQARFVVAAPTDVTSDLVEVPTYSRLIESQRARAGAVPLARAGACSAAVTLPTQLAPEAASAALAQAGFTVIGSAAFRAEGVREGFWFGFTHDAVIRIRPGKSDVRVTAREAVAQGDEACRLAGAIVQALQSAR